MENPLNNQLPKPEARYVPLLLHPQARISVRANKYSTVQAVTTTRAQLGPYFSSVFVYSFSLNQSCPLLLPVILYFCAELSYPTTYLFLFQRNNIIIGTTIMISGDLPPDTSNNAVKVGVTTTFLMMALFFYGLRMYSRCRPTPHFGLDDYTLSLAMVRTKLVLLQ